MGEGRRDLPLALHVLPRQPRLRPAARARPDALGQADRRARDDLRAGEGLPQRRRARRPRRGGDGPHDLGVHAGREGRDPRRDARRGGRGASARGHGAAQPGHRPPQPRRPEGRARHLRAGPQALLGGQGSRRPRFDDQRHGQLQVRPRRSRAAPASPTRRSFGSTARSATSAARPARSATSPTSSATRAISPAASGMAEQALALFQEIGDRRRRGRAAQQHRSGARDDGRHPGQPRPLRARRAHPRRARRHRRARHRPHERRRARDARLEHRRGGEELLARAPDLPRVGPEVEGRLSARRPRRRQVRDRRPRRGEGDARRRASR